MIVNSSFFKKQFDVSKAELIGEGNFAQVYRVYDSDLQSYLAIRRVDRDLGQSEDIEKQKTINQQLRRVQNEHILKIFDIIQSQTCIWYITQYCEGGSLWDALNNCIDNKMSQKDALQIVYQVSKGVKQLHNHRITHRDLKPQNILLKTKYINGKTIPTIKIADFGLSTKKIIMQTIAGTKQYIAPEQARFHNYTNAVDVWSLGIIFDQILHGSPFYVGDNNKQVFQKILKNPYKVRDQSIRSSIQQFLISVLKKKAYERPIIAVICQSIQKILQQIKKQKKQAQEIVPEKMQKPTFQKKLKHILPATQQVKSAVIQINSNTNNQQISKQLNNSLRDVVEQNKFDNSRSDNKSVTRKDERKAKTPFKRQNGRPELMKPNEQSQLQTSTGMAYLQRNQRNVPNKKDIDSRVISRQLSNQATLRTQQVQSNAQKYDKSNNKFIDKSDKNGQKLLQKSATIQRTGFNQKNPALERTYTLERSQQPIIQKQRTNQKLQRPQSSQPDKINIYRVEKRKLQNLPSKGLELSPNIIDIRQYMQNMLKLKSQLLQNNISVGKQRQFIPNAQLSISEFPQKFDSQEVLRRMRKSYEFLNYVNYKPDYEIKLCIGKNTLNQQKDKAQAELLQHKQKIKKNFLLQIDKFVDYYVNKILK